MSNTNTLTDYVLMPSADYIDMCNAIREKTGITGDLISSQLGNIIRSIQGSVVLPTHTVNFYNDTTLLQSYANVVYGSTVTYTGETPTKASTATMSYTFDRFEPSGARITGDTNCYAQFIETAIGGGDEGEITYGWVPMAADGVSYMGEEVTIPGGNLIPNQFEYVVSETDQYRVTINGTEHLFSFGDEDAINIAENDNTVEGGLWVIRNNGIFLFQRYSPDAQVLLPSITTTLKFESYAAIPSQPETTGEWVPFCTDGTTWTGEEVRCGTNIAPPVYLGDVNLSPTGQYRITANDETYIVPMTSSNSDSITSGDMIYSEECPVELYFNGTYWDVDHSGVDTDNNASKVTFTLKVESWTGSEPYIPEEPEVISATFTPWNNCTIPSGSLLNFQVNWGDRPYAEFEGYLDGNNNIEAYSFYDSRASSYVVRLTNNTTTDFAVSPDVTYTIIITNVIAE